MVGRMPKAPASPDPSQLIYDASGNYDYGRGGPIMEEGDMRMRLPENRAEALASTPQPENTIARFVNEALSDPSKAASCLTVRMDVAQYWEKRRVQNVLRRVLEAVQERFGLDGVAQSDNFGDVYDNVAQQVGHRGGAEGGLDEQTFIKALDALGLWPPELSKDDRVEIFHAMLVPSVAAVRSVLRKIQPMRLRLTRELFREGFECVPFNLPDFPVPTHLIAPAFKKPLEQFNSIQRDECTEVVVRSFYLGTKGVDKTKDFFISGLLSLEEIQMGLPRLLPQAVVEDCVTRIIRKGAPLMSTEEWQSLVLNVRTPQACGQAVAEDPIIEETPRSPERQVAAQCTSQMQRERAVEPVAAASGGATSTSAGKSMFGIPNTPAQQTREVLQVAAPLAETMLNEFLSLSPALEYRNVRGLDQWAPEGDADVDRGRGRFEPVTEPLPCRNIRCEEPVVNFSLGGVSTLLRQAPTRVVDWNTAVSEADQSFSGAASSVDTARAQAEPEGAARQPGLIGWHKADEGAGARASWGTRCFKQELAAAASKPTTTEPVTLMPGGADPVAWINIDLHHECGGPYLTHAFVRCCRLFYDAAGYTAHPNS